MIPIPQPSDNDMPAVDYYRELGLERGGSIQETQTKIQKLKKLWGQRASLAGKRGDEARRTLALLEEALLIFKDEESRERYERSLRGSTSDSDESVDWVARAWTYYFAEDFGPAMVAARKARENCPTDPTAFVVSAWIALKEDEYKLAEDYASEAFVLDELGEDTMDVHRVRGAVFYLQNKYERAYESLKRALSRATEEYKSDTYWRLALCEFKLNRMNDAMASCLAGLEKDTDGSSRDMIIQVAHRITMDYVRGANTWEERTIRAQQHLTLVNNSAVVGVPKRVLKEEREKLIQALTIAREAEELRAKLLDSYDYDFPLKTIGAAVIFLIVFFSYPTFITFLLFIAPATWAGYVIYKRHDYSSMEKDYESKLATLDRLEEELLAPEEKDAQFKFKTFTTLTEEIQKQAERDRKALDELNSL